MSWNRNSGEGVGVCIGGASTERLEKLVKLEQI